LSPANTFVSGARVAAIRISLAIAVPSLNTTENVTGLARAGADKAPTDMAIAKSKRLFTVLFLYDSDSAAVVTTTCLRPASTTDARVDKIMNAIMIKENAINFK
jgi:hypothetical protein